MTAKLKPLMLLAGVSAALLLAFTLGAKTDQPAGNLPFLRPTSTPTPTPDHRLSLKQAGYIGNLSLMVNYAWRILRPGSNQDLGIVEVTFTGQSDCEDSQFSATCTFDKSKFQLGNSQQQLQSISTPPNQFIRGMKIRQLYPKRTLYNKTSETGQLYFLLDKQVLDFTLTYTPVAGQSAQFKLEPITYTYRNAVENLITTPFPLQGIVTPSVTP